VSIFLTFFCSRKRRSWSVCDTVGAIISMTSSNEGSEKNDIGGYSGGKKQAATGIQDPAARINGMSKNIGS